MSKLTGLQGSWFMGKDYFESCFEAYTRFQFDQPSYDAFIERRSRSGSEDGSLFIVSEGVARIPILGVLTKAPDFFFDMFGGGSAVYGDIIAAVQAADADDEVERIVLEIDSPGGEVFGFFETAKAIAEVSKPIEAQVTDFAASAAFGLAASAGRIVVNNAMAMVGSVGMVTTRFISEFRVNVTSTDAPKKAPDASTAAGIKAIREELDPLHEQFAGIIAAGRGVTIKTVNADFGRGGMLIAADALRVGMIDAIGSESIGAKSPGSTSTTARVQTMNEDEFKAQHPALYASIQAAARTAGIEAGIAQERDRVTAHANSGEAFGCPEIAMKHIASGVDFSSQSVQAEYIAAGANSAESSNRADDDKDADAANGADAKSANGESKPDTAAVENAIFDELDTQRGITTA